MQPALPDLLVLFTVVVMEHFVPVTDAHGVHVSRRTDVPEIEILAVGEIAAPPDRVRAVLLDYEHAGTWVKAVAESRVLGRGDGFLDVYQRLELPILDDRDFTLHVVWGEDAGALWMRFAAANERGPAPRRKVVRMSIHEGWWRLEPIDGGRKTRATYRVRMDLAGSLPAWMARGRTADDIPALFEALRRQAAR